MMNRRQFLTSLASLTGLGIASTVGITQTPTGKDLLKKIHLSKIPTKLLGQNHQVGHVLREQLQFTLLNSETMGNTEIPQEKKPYKTDVVVIGGGIAGLSAGKRLTELGISFDLFELEDHFGGSSASRSNSVSAYPLGAHYVPLLSSESIEAKEFFKQIGIITHEDEQGKAHYNPYYLVSDPNERVFYQGRWYEDLVPLQVLSNNEQTELKKFFDLIDTLKHQIGRDGKRLFAIPLDRSSSDNEWRKLDNLSMAEWLTQNNYHSDYLHWLINYACRDDFGTDYQQTSAWAGLHYFAGRNGTAGNTTDSDVVTWAEGNGFLVNQLKQRCPAKQLHQHSLVFSVEPNDHHDIIVKTFDPRTQTVTQYQCNSVIVASPYFINQHIISAKLLPKIEKSQQPSYAPWLIANITLHRLPPTMNLRMAWDNVVFDSPFLGYVVATHQNTQLFQSNIVITYYFPLSEQSPEKSREMLLNTEQEVWKELFLNEFLNIHPELADFISEIEFWRWGHGMVRPHVGYIWGETRQQLQATKPPLFLAHSDISGISIFEEAFTNGYQSAEKCAEFLNQLKSLQPSEISGSSKKLQGQLNDE